MESIGVVLEKMKEVFSFVGLESPQKESEHLLEDMLGVKRTEMFLKRETPLSAEQLVVLNTGLLRRLAREPLAYITGRKNFRGVDFIVDPRVLIPRPETELLVEEAIREIQASEIVRPLILDVGTGSGCIAVTLALRIPNAGVHAVDISPGALQVATENAHKNGVKIEFRQSDLLKGLDPENQGAFDMILANPPYIASMDLPHLQPELFFEPNLALDGGVDGLEVIRRLVDESRPFLKSNGWLVMEIGHNQGNSVRSLMEAADFLNVQILKDLSGLDRIAKGKKIGSI